MTTSFPVDGPTDWFYRTLVPKDPVDNVAWRKSVLEKGYRSKKFAAALRDWCARDILFYLNTFGYLLEVRDKAPWQPSRCFGKAREIPFITRPYQDEAILRICAALGQRDIRTLKSREMGATWLNLYVVDHSWRFHPHSHFGLVSKDEKSVDNPDDPDSLMSKLDFIDDHLPRWLRPTRNRNTSKHTIKNVMNLSTITGAACTGDMFRGGRKLMIVADEMHAWPTDAEFAAHDSMQHVTYCRNMISTPVRDKGQSGAFFKVCQDKHSDMERIDLDWKDDPDKCSGLYTSEGSSLVLLDKGFKHPEGYKFILDGKVRSPYYDWECRRPLATEQSIAAELDKDFGGATNRFFDPTIIARGFSIARDPSYRCRLEVRDGRFFPSLILDERGDIELWTFPVSGLTFDDDNRLVVPASRAYASGWDIAAGLHGKSTSYSAGSFLDETNGEQVAMWMGNDIPPHELPELAVAICQVFNNALINPEVTGMGNTFVNFLQKTGYTNIWRRPVQEGSIGGQRASVRLGYDNKDGGKTIFTALQNAIQLGKVSIRSQRVIEECERYYIDVNGKLKHPLIGKGRDNAPEVSHGDCAIATATGWYAIHTRPAHTPTPDEEAINPDSQSGRRGDIIDSRRRGKSRSWWPKTEVKTLRYREILEK
jgi:hypothetical protein